MSFLSTALRNDRNEFLHRPLRSITCTWCAIVVGMGSCIRATDRKTEKYEYRRTEKISCKLEELDDTICEDYDMV